MFKENLTKAQQTCNLLRSDVVQMYHESHVFNDGNPKTPANYALIEYCSNLLMLVKDLEHKLLSLGK